VKHAFLLAAVMCLVASCTGPGHRARPRVAIHTPSPSMTASAAPSPTSRPRRPRPTPPNGRWLPEGVRKVSDLKLPYATLVAGRHALFAVVPVDTSRSHPSDRIARVDPRTGEVVQGRAFPVRPGYPFRSYLATAAGVLWAGGLPRAGGQGGVLYGFDPRTLTIDRRVALPRRLGPLAATPTGLWVGSNRRLFLVDPAQDTIISTVSVRGTVVRLAVDPSRRTIYVAMDVPGFSDGLPVEARDASTGALEAISPVPTDFGANWLAAASRGVWVSEPTGNFGAAYFLRADDLHQVGDFIEANQEVVASLAGRTLWVPQDLGRELKCLDPLTGRKEGAIRFPKDAPGRYAFSQNVVAVDGTVFTAMPVGVVSISPTACA
jgi:hypothetical protein